MNEKQNGIDETELHAYVDGQLCPDRIDAVEAALADDDELAQRAKVYAAQNEEIRVLFGPVALEQTPGRLRPRRLARTGARRRWLAPLAASVVWLAVGLAGGWFAKDRLGVDAVADATRHVVSDAVSAHRVYAVETLHPVEVFADREAHLVKWLSKRLGHTIRMPDLSPLGFKLIGGRLLPSEGGAPAAQFMYEDSFGQRVTIYLAPYHSGVETTFQYQETQGASAFIWLEPDIAFAIAGNLPREPLLEVSKIVYDAYENQ